MVKMENKSIAILSGIFLLGAIGAFLIIPMSFQDTIILTTKNGGGPVSCLDDGALILPQNLTDLCDVTIINPITSELLQYNGTQWVNVNSTTISVNSTISCNSTGGFISLCSSPNPDFNSVNIKTLEDGGGINLIDNGTFIIIDNSAPESTQCINQITGQGLCINDNIELKNLLAGSGISLSSNSTHITITNTGVTSNTATSPIVVSGATGTVNISCPTCITSSTPRMEQLCQNTLIANATSISCGAFTARQHLLVTIEYRTQTNTMVEGIRFNSDSGTNYATRSSSNGGADSTGTSLTQCTLRGGGSFANNDRGLMEYWIYNNQAGDRKSMIGDIVAGGDTSAGTAPIRIEQACKWDNTSAQITTIQLMRVSGSGSYASGTEITVWGYD